MADDATGVEPRYWAFISYSHKDAAFGRWLHRKLENYALPRRLTRRITAQGVIPGKLVPIFRDREEFAAATDLSAEVRAALAQSRSLIVVCSPDTPASQWVSREVTVFRALHPDRPILAAIRDGEPAVSFPKSLLTTSPSGEPIEPLAADFRARRDGQQLGVLKLVAGMTGLGLDELVQRDTQRYRQRVTAITALALLAMTIMGVLTAVAVQARREADRQRAEAEGLVEYMLTDLREKLKGVGRLDVMTDVNERAFKHYQSQDLASLPPDALERRARTLHAMGEDDESRNDHKNALLKFREAERTTAALLKAAPNDPERVFDQAQSVFWLGGVDYQQGRLTDAIEKWREYRELALRMIALSPGSTKYRLELAYADSNFCYVPLNNPNHAGAIKACTTALADIQNAASHPDANYTNREAHRVLTSQLMNSLSQLSDAYRMNNNLTAARLELKIEENLLDHELAADPKNKDLKDYWIIVQRDYAHMDERQGNWSEAEVTLERAIAAANQMVKFDPSNAEWAQFRSDLLHELVQDRQHRQNSSNPQHH
jgi:hypothetical protein